MKLLKASKFDIAGTKPAIWKTEEEDLVPGFVCLSYFEGMRCSYEPDYVVMQPGGDRLEAFCDRHFDPELEKRFMFLAR